jgi:hypothetical protein
MKKANKNFNLTIICGLIILLIIFINIICLNYNFFNKKTILNKQKVLFSKFGIASYINYDGTIIITDPTISESTLKKLQFVTNNPSLNPAPMNLIDIKVFLNEIPLHVNGFFKYCREKIDKSDKIAFNQRKTVHSPLLDANVVDKLLGYKVHGNKTFQIILDPPSLRPPDNALVNDINNKSCLGQYLGCDNICNSKKVIGGCDKKCGSDKVIGCDGICGSNKVIGCDRICGSNKSFARIDNFTKNEIKCCDGIYISRNNVCCDGENVLDKYKNCCPIKDLIKKDNRCYFEGETPGSPKITGSGQVKVYTLGGSK